MNEIKHRAIVNSMHFASMYYLYFLYFYTLFIVVMVEPLPPLLKQFESQLALWFKED